VSDGLTPEASSFTRTSPPFQNILDLQYKLRCRECDVRGKVVVSITWAIT
jgi:hypothetical protein